MNLDKITALIQNGESHTVEFKKSTAQLKPAFESVCAFLNAQGGIVLIGVSDNGKIVGQDVSDNTRQEIAREINKIEPPAQLNVSYILSASNKYIIVIEVNPDNHSPYIYDGRAFERSQTTTVRMAQHRYDQLVSRRFQHNFSWEKLEAENYLINDLDRNLVLGIVRKAVDVGRMPEDALRQDLPELIAAMQLSKEHILLNASIALFGKKIRPDFPQCQLKMARFQGLDRNKFIDSDIQYGNVFLLLDSAMSFIRRHLPLASKIEPGQLERVETPIIPFEAIREAIINSLCHRDYAQQSGSIGIAIYDDRMELFNNGGLDPNVTLEKIKKGFSNPTNPLIADVFYRCKLIEKWGRGVPKIISSCKEAHDPEPEFIIDQSEFRVVFKFPSPITPPVILFNEQPKASESLTSRQIEIIQILSSVSELKPKELLDKLREHTTERTLRRDLAKLKEQGILSTRGQGPAVVWFCMPPVK
jgi:ATP-dependent DNA helicase RecG